MALLPFSAWRRLRRIDVLIRQRDAPQLLHKAQAAPANPHSRKRAARAVVVARTSALLMFLAPVVEHREVDDGEEGVELPLVWHGVRAAV